MIIIKRSMLLWSQGDQSAHTAMSSEEAQRLRTRSSRLITPLQYIRNSILHRSTDFKGYPFGGPACSAHWATGLATASSQLLLAHHPEHKAT